MFRRNILIGLPLRFAIRANKVFVHGMTRATPTTPSSATAEAGRRHQFDQLRDADAWVEGSAASRRGNKLLSGDEVGLVGQWVDPVDRVVEQNIGVDPPVPQPEADGSEAGFPEVTTGQVGEGFLLPVIWASHVFNDGRCAHGVGCSCGLHWWDLGEAVCMDEFYEAKRFLATKKTAQRAACGAQRRAAGGGCGISRAAAASPLDEA